ncbi:MAG: hypothetical protein PHG03_03695 [Bacilli bacterium]|nr:hypothetical protein [Bacilli bacterium]MDD4795644.1 hypothetical protein [Bacilli bacterium]
MKFLNKIFKKKEINEEESEYNTFVVKESSRIEEQLTDNTEIKKPEKEENIDAFNMSPSEKTEVEVLDLNLHKTQKFCPECRTPNDILNKYCISCGYNFK